jgi:transposase InsO family protein
VDRATVISYSTLIERRHSLGPIESVRSCREIYVSALQNNPFIQPGKPNANAFIGSFNGKFRDECLNEHWFITMAHARRDIETWRIQYNTERPHS